jgi:hypothetical protein
MKPTSNFSGGGFAVVKFAFASFCASVLAFVAWIPSARADVVSVTLDCSSVGDAYTECDTGMSFTDAKMVSENVVGSCVYGSTWGTYENSIWVNHGCSGRFTVSAEETEPTPAPAPPPPATSALDCRFNSVNWQPYNGTLNRFIGRAGYGFQDANMCLRSVRMSRENAVCNWVGNGFTPYDVDTNAELFFAAYPTIESCYAAVR